MPDIESSPISVDSSLWPGNQLPYKDEGPAALDRRLRRAGLLRAYEADKQFLLERGVVDAESVRSEMRANPRWYPPVEVVKEVEVEEGPAVAVKRPLAGVVRGGIRESAAFPWRELSAIGDMKADVLWVYRNFSAVVEETKSTVWLHWHRAKEPPTSCTVEALMHTAALNRNKFLFDIAPKYLIDDEDECKEQVREERKSIEAIREVLKRMKECEVA